MRSPLGGYTVKSNNNCEGVIPIVFIFSGLLFLSILLIVKGGIKKIKEVPTKDEMEEYLQNKNRNDLSEKTIKNSEEEQGAETTENKLKKRIDIERNSKYVDETKNKINEILQTYDSGEYDEKVLLKELEKIQLLKNEWVDLKEELHSLIIERRNFITTSSFYPREYASKLTEMEVLFDSALESIKKNPLGNQDKIKQMINKEKNKVSAYIEAKAEIELNLDRLTSYGKTLKKKKEQIKYYSDMQNMILQLQKGESESALLILEKIKNNEK